MDIKKRFTEEQIIGLLRQPGAVQSASNLITRDTVGHRNVETLLGEVVNDGQAEESMQA
ncbi:hypothetical protein RPW65_01360 [Pseudomonas sp. NyZ704]|nr:hypothetical protein RPW65_01360 [Pseudomonas sp. NyZ704]